VTGTVFERSTFVAADVATVFAYCNSADGFRQLFPYPVEWVSGPPVFRFGDSIAFRYRCCGVWLPHAANVVDWVKDEIFVDAMTRGQFRFFHHTHRFAAEGDGTRLTDSIVFRLGLGRLIDRTIGQLILNSIFARRHARIKAALEAPRP
jgi:ligand-binding SRPBCC domain-containing protein